MVSISRRSALISHRCDPLISSPGRTIVFIGLSLSVLGLSGCGGDTQPQISKSELKAVEALKADTAKSKSSKSRYKNEAPNADLGPKERRALKLKGQLPSS
jgi:hypothetical protein